MKLKRNYLTAGEMIEVVRELSKIEDVCEREIIKVGMAYQLLVEDFAEDLKCDEYYDLYMSDEDIDFERDIVNYIDIDMLVDKATSIEVEINKLLKELQSVAKDLNINDILNTFDKKDVLQLVSQLNTITEKFK